jgi:hypothetical protein
MKSKLLIIILSIFFSGCQSAMSVFNRTDSSYEKGLQYTKVKSIVYKGETKAIINITYLNSINKRYDNQYQNFLVGIYIVEDNEEESTKFLNNYRYKLTLNGNNFIKSNVLNDEYELYENIPLKNPWARYYLISFDNDDKKELKLKYKNPIFGEVNITFDKE